MIWKGSLSRSSRSFFSEVIWKGSWSRSFFRKWSENDLDLDPFFGNDLKGSWSRSFFRKWSEKDLDLDPFWKRGSDVDPFQYDLEHVWILCTSKEISIFQIYLHWWGICTATWPARLFAYSRTVRDQRVAQRWCSLASPRSGLAISGPCLTSTQSKAAYTNFAHCTCQFFPFANCYHDTHRLRPYRRYVTAEHIPNVSLNLFRIPQFDQCFPIF